MNHFFRAGFVVWACRIAFFVVLRMLSMAALDAFLLAASFLIVDLTLCMRLSRATRAAELMSGWRAAGYEELPATQAEPARATKD